MRLRISHWAINKLTDEELRMILCIGHRFPILLFACAVKLCLQSRASWLEIQRTRTSFWTSKSAFPAVVEQLWGAHTMDWVHLRVDGCGGDVEDKQSHSWEQLGYWSCASGCRTLPDCVKKLGFVSCGDLEKPDGIKSHYWLLSVLMCSFPFCSRNLFYPIVCHRPSEMKRCFQASL